MTQAREGRVTLTKPAFEDLAFIKELWTDPETNKFTGGPYQMQDETTWFQRWIDPGLQDRRYALICNQEGLTDGDVFFVMMTKEQFFEVAKKVGFHDNDRDAGREGSAIFDGFERTTAFHRGADA